MSLWVHFGASGAYKCDFSTLFRKEKEKKSWKKKLTLIGIEHAISAWEAAILTTRP